jgi:oxygen-independent coproporphyrinogen-3 oxidase
MIDNLPFDFMLNALRLRAGFDCSLFESRTGNSIKIIREKIDKLNSLGLLEVGNNSIKPTVKGYNFMNDLQSYFL